jgi:hypothetical protein
MATDLDALTGRCQVLYDVAGSLVLAASEWASIINDSYRKLWRTVVRINKSFRVTTDPFTLAAGDQLEALPSDYRETLMVRLDPGTESQVILQRLTPRVAANQQARSYRLQGTNLVIEPLSQCAGSYDHVYIPNAPLLTVGRDIVTDPGDDSTNGSGQFVWDAEAFTSVDVGKTLVVTGSVGADGTYVVTAAVGKTLTVTPAAPVGISLNVATTAEFLTSSIDAELEQFAEFLVYDAVNVALAREESERAYEIDFQRAEKDVIAWASSQRSADPDTVEDVRGRQRWGWGIP